MSRHTRYQNHGRPANQQDGARQDRGGYSRQADDRADYAGFGAAPADQPGPRRGGALPLAGVAIWSLVVWLAYLAVAALAGLISGNVAWVATSITNLASAIGLGKLAEALNPAWWIDTALWLATALLLPVTVVVWAIGSLLIFLAPNLIELLRNRRRY